MKETKSDFTSNQLWDCGQVRSPFIQILLMSVHFATPSKTLAPYKSLFIVLVTVGIINKIYELPGLNIVEYILTGILMIIIYIKLWNAK